MPKANEVKIIKTTAEADLKEEVKVPEDKAPTAAAPAEETPKAAKETAAPAEKKAPARKRAASTAKKTAAKGETKETAKEAETKTTRKKTQTAAAETTGKKTQKAAAETTGKKTQTAEKKAPANGKTAASRKAKEAVYLQYAGRELEISDIVEKAKNAYGGRSIKEIRVYVKPEENMAYYVVNGKETGSVQI